MTNLRAEDQIFQAPENLTEHHRQILEDFKAPGLWTLPDGSEYKIGEQEKYLGTDWTANRFLVARDWNVKLARSMFQEHLLTRQKMDLGNIIERFSINSTEEEAIRKYCPQGWLGTDFAGRPIYYQAFTELDGSRLLQGISADRILECQAYTCELLIKKILPACSAYFKKPVRQTASLIDFRDVGYSQLWTARWFAKKYLAFQESQYPDYLGVSYIINAPRALHVVWQMAQKILPRATAEKVQILGTDYQATLLKHISKDNLPVEYGGTRTDKRAGPPTLEAILGKAAQPENAS